MVGCVTPRLQPTAPELSVSWYATNSKINFSCTCCSGSSRTTCIRPRSKKGSRFAHLPTQSRRCFRVGQLSIEITLRFRSVSVCSSVIINQMHAWCFSITKSAFIPYVVSVRTLHTGIIHNAGVNVFYSLWRRFDYCFFFFLTLHLYTLCSFFSR